MKASILLAGMLAIPAGIAWAQATGTANGNAQYVALSSSNGSTGTAGAPVANTTWFIDTVNRVVILCAQTSQSGSGGAPSFSCSAQAAPAVVNSVAGAARSAADGGSGSTGNSMGSVLASPFRTN